MRVLMVTSPMVGHVLPLVPLARALRKAGHEVRMATGGSGLAACPDDVPTTDVAPGIRPERLFGRALAPHPLLLRAEMTGRGGTRAVRLMFAALGEAVADCVLALAERFAPDLVVQEPFAVAGALAASVREVPTVLVDTSLFDTTDHYTAVASAFVRGARRRGVDRLPDPADTLTTAPPSLVGPRSGRAMRFVPVAADGPVPEDLTAPGARPRVLVGRSTVDDPRRDRLMTTVAAAAKGAAVDVVLVRPDRWVVQRPLPPNVRTTGFVPFPAVLPSAAGMVHHGGAGTLLTALACGVPQLVVPGAGDRRVNAELVAARGAGLAVDLPDLDRATLERLVGDPDLSTAADEVAAEIAGMPAPDDVVGALCDLAGSRS